MSRTSTHKNAAVNTGVDVPWLAGNPRRRKLRIAVSALPTYIRFGESMTAAAQGLQFNNTAIVYDFDYDDWGELITLDVHIWCNAAGTVITSLEAVDS